MGKDQILFQTYKASVLLSCVLGEVLPTRMKHSYRHKKRDSCDYIDICTVSFQLPPPELKRRRNSHKILKPRSRTPAAGIVLVAQMRSWNGVFFFPTSKYYSDLTVSNAQVTVGCNCSFCFIFFFPEVFGIKLMTVKHTHIYFLVGGWDAEDRFQW